MLRMVCWFDFQLKPLPSVGHDGIAKTKEASEMSNAKSIQPTTTAEARLLKEI